ncbi:MAG: hypothetical protein JXM73_19560, partial [Anaerolineae bacterium]|nr:hypothetical protein [Anaerolineae bacterium]
MAKFQNTHVRAVNRQSGAAEGGEAWTRQQASVRLDHGGPGWGRVAVTGRASQDPSRWASPGQVKVREPNQGQAAVREVDPAKEMAQDLAAVREVDPAK